MLPLGPTPLGSWPLQNFPPLDGLSCLWNAEGFDILILAYPGYTGNSLLRDNYHYTDFLMTGLWHKLTSKLQTCLWHCEGEEVMRPSHTVSWARQTCDKSCVSVLYVAQQHDVPSISLFNGDIYKSLEAREEAMTLWWGSCRLVSDVARKLVTSLWCHGQVHDKSTRKSRINRQQLVPCRVAVMWIGLKWALYYTL